MTKTIKSYQALLIILSLIIQVSCTSESVDPNKEELTKESFIPKPVSVTSNQTVFKLTGSTQISGIEGMEKNSAFLAEKISKATGFKLPVKTVANAPGKGIFLTLTEGENNLGTEGYELTIAKKLITIKANSPAGCFNGLQTLLQTLPVKAAPSEVVYLAGGVITDSPYYEYRGAMLDVARHFFGVADVKRYIDFLAMYKMNVLHLHLSDDQGWRIEIKSWPNLTTHGGSTQVGGGEGGFYTQEQYTEIVNYAMDRNITIVPEIDMPGHTNAALASYPELNCNGKAPELYTGTRVGFSTFCTDKEITYTFIDDVVREIAALTPGPYFHIGGDESHVTKMEDYIPFVNRVQEIVVKHGKKVIGWDEIANASLVENSAVQFWADVNNTTMGAKQGARVLMSPATKAYLDMQYDSTTHLGLHWAAYIEVDEGYNWNPETLVPGIGKEKILGIEAPLWSETVTNIDEIEYMVFPRLPGYAEIGWSAPDNRSWDEYKTRLAKHGKRFKDMEINFYRSERVPWVE